MPEIAAQSLPPRLMFTDNLIQLVKHDVTLSERTIVFEVGVPISRDGCTNNHAFRIQVEQQRVLQRIPD